VIVVPLTISRLESCSAVGQESGRGIVGVEVLDAARGEICLQQIVAPERDEFDPYYGISNPSLPVVFSNYTQESAPSRLNFCADRHERM
jgi:hypothetical protein